MRGFALALALSALSLPALANDQRAALDYFRLCIFEGFFADPSKKPLGFSKATSVAPDLLFQSMPPLPVPFEVFAAWDISPDLPYGEGALVAAVTLDHPTLGRMPGCVMLLQTGDAGTVAAGLTALGATRDGRFLFADGPRFVWMITVNSAPGGETIIVGFAPQT